MFSVLVPNPEGQWNSDISTEVARRFRGLESRI